MRERYKRDAKIGIIGGLIGFFLIILPLWKLYNWVVEMVEFSLKEM